MRSEQENETRGSGGSAARGIDAGPTIVPPGDVSESAVSEMAERVESRAAHGEPKRTRWGVLRHRDFRNVWIAAFGSSVGSWMEMIGVQWAMATATLAPEWVNAGRPGAPIMAGYLAVAQMAPTLVFGLLGGVVADRVDRKKLLLLTQALLMGVAAVLTFAAFTDRLTPVLLLVMGAVNGLIIAFNIPAWQVLTPRLVPREELPAAVNLNGIQFNAARVLGPALGGVLMAQYGAGVLFAVNTLSFLGVLAAVWTTPPSPPPPRTGDGPMMQIKEAFVYTFTRKGPLLLITAISLFSLLGTPVLRMLPILVKEVYGLKEDAYGKLMAALGLGAVGVALLMPMIPKWYPRHHLIPLAMTGAGVCIALFAAAPTYTLALPIMVVVGGFWILSFNPAFAALQMLVEDRIRGRVLAVCNMVSFGAMPIGALLTGGISEQIAGRSDNGFGTQVGVGLLAVLMTLVGLVMLTFRTPEIDGIKPGEPGYEKKPGLIRGITAAGHRPRS